MDRLQGPIAAALNALLRELVTEMRVGIIELAHTSADRMSEIATLLTIISAIILPLTLITGIYGMRFDDIPEIYIPGG